MKIDRKKRNITISLLVIIVVIVSLVLLLHKSKVDKEAASIKNKSAADTAELNKDSAKKSNPNSTTDNSKTGRVKSGGKETSVANNDIANKGKVQTAKQKQTILLIQQNAKIAAQEKPLTAAQVKDENTKVKSSKDGLVVFIKAANFGSTAEIIKDNKKFGSYKYYQFSIGNKHISAIESISKSKITLFPVQNAGTEVVVKFLDQNKKVIKELNIKLSVR
ncbi:hypothetical protein KTC96_16680 [Clostridium estertheticum]|uniref:hypothetical protein n=1 Tax=Clostridium estertheticum TaxID=238834 RepID=UPI001C7E1AD4|nr:hypothetical protein [Clostridium estertheticum]MBX4261023.1 hypothetical protein [Clostridium estertheticum]WLC69573.1 hypothetical protein KTC96_16680 [Clostridium estertheticum]